MVLVSPRCQWMDRATHRRYKDSKDHHGKRWDDNGTTKTIMGNGALSQGVSTSQNTGDTRILKITMGNARMIMGLQKQ